MRKIPIGLQLYSLREESKKDFGETIKKVAGMGFEGVEFAGYFGKSAKEVRKMLDDSGLKAFGTHLGIEALLGDEFQKTVDFNLAIGNKYLIVAGLSGEYTSSKADWLKAADAFNGIAGKLKAHHLQTGFHCHHDNFVPREGEPGWDIFFKNTNPEVVMQLDSGNAMEGGADPLELVKRYPGRTSTIHLKDFSKTKKDVLLGEGEMKWKDLLELCSTVGKTEFYIVEQERYPYPPLESVKRCLDSLTAFLK
jgi:sugar phosphate isomerase/epimerase